MHLNIKVILASGFVFFALLQPAYAASATDFSDVPENHWARKAIEQMVKLGIATGFPDGTFRGNSTFNRYETVVFLNNIYSALSDKMVEVSKQQIKEALEKVDSGGDSALPGAQTVANRKMLYELKDEVDALRADLRALRYSVQRQQKKEEEDFSVRGRISPGIWSESLVIKNSGSALAFYGVHEATVEIDKKLQDNIKLKVEIDRHARRWEQDITLASFDLNTALSAEWGIGEFPITLRWSMGRGQYVDSFTGEVVQAYPDGVELKSELFGLPLNLGYFQKNTAATLASTANSYTDPTDRAVLQTAAQHIHGQTGLAFPLGSWIFDLSLQADSYAAGAYTGTGTKDMHVMAQLAVEGDGFSLKGGLGSNFGKKMFVRGDYELFSLMGTALHLKLSAVGSNGTATDVTQFWSDPDLGQDVVGVDIFNQPVNNGDYVYTISYQWPLSPDAKWNSQSGISLIGQDITQFTQRIKALSEISYQMADHAKWSLQYRLDMISATYISGVASNADGLRFGMTFDF